MSHFKLEYIKLHVITTTVLENKYVGQNKYISTLAIYSLLQN